MPQKLDFQELSFFSGGNHKVRKDLARAQQIIVVFAELL